MLESEETRVTERKGVAALVSVNRESACWWTYSMWVSWDVWKHNIGGWAVRHEWVQQCVIHVCVVLLCFLIFHISCRESSPSPVCDSTLSPPQVLLDWSPDCSLLSFCFWGFSWSLSQCLKSWNRLKSPELGRISHSNSFREGERRTRTKLHP